MRVKAIVGVICLFGLVTAGCSSGDDSAFGENTIVVLDDAGTLTLIESETGEATEVPVSSGARSDFPAWAPDASKLAFTATEGGNFSLGVYDGDEVRTIGTEFPSFYNYFDPTSQVVGYLGNLRNSVGFGVADVEGGQASTIDSSQPYFFSWADDGTRVVSHSDGELSVLDTAGEELLSLSVSPLFQAPIWLPGGDEVVVALPAVEGSRLVVVDVSSGDERELVQADGVLALVLDPTGQRLAVVRRDRGGDGAVLQASTRGQASDPVPAGLFTIELDSGAIVAIDDDPFTLAPFWSPGGQLVLSLTVDDDEPGRWARWQVHDVSGELVVESDRMNPSRTVAQLLPFADQYAQSMTPWSPDGEAFVFAGTVEGGGGADGIHVQRIDESGGAIRLSDGVYAMWSPR